MTLLPRGRLGYAVEAEDKQFLIATGEEPNILLARYNDTFPKLDTTDDPTGILKIKDQGSVGSCQGQALSTVFAICYWLATGRREVFSSAAAYILSQRRDGIRGDNGSTLSAGQWVATNNGLCLESAWPYSPNYNSINRVPPGITYPFKLSVTRPMRSADEVFDWLNQGLPVQIGIGWNNYCDREVVDQWQSMRNQGGHSTVFWQFRDGNVNNINSWGTNWNGDGQHSFTHRAVEQLIRHQWTVMIGYAPDAMSFPPLEPIT